jgi:hypothetical protein
MYGQTARKAILRVLKEAPELADLQTKAEATEQAKPWSKVRDHRSRKLADRLIAELWMMGFAVSARKPSDHEPVKGGRDPEVHKAWRNSKLKPPPERNQSDVETQAQKSPETA